MVCNRSPRHGASRYALTPHPERLNPKLGREGPRGVAHGFYCVCEMCNTPLGFWMTVRGLTTPPAANPHVKTGSTVFRPLIYLDRPPPQREAVKVNQRSATHPFGLDVRVGGIRYLDDLVDSDQ